jgi:hypothetical protein
MPHPLINAFLKETLTQGSRSTVLRPLAWLVGICAATVIGATEVKAASWVLWLFGVAAGVGILIYLSAFIFCLFTDREDLLRSETYSIQKLAIEKGFVGDSVSGIFEQETSGQQRLLSEGNDTTADEK